MRSGRLLEAMHKLIRKPKIGDVAARAGVSTATVSRTLATPDQVTPKTREAVMKAVRETGYVLNVAARNLRTSRTQLGHQLRRPRRIRATPTHQQQIPDPAVGHHMTRQRRTRHPGTTGDHHRARRPRIRHRQHNLADMTRLR